MRLEKPSRMTTHRMAEPERLMAARPGCLIQGKPIQTTMVLLMMVLPMMEQHPMTAKSGCWMRMELAQLRMVPKTKQQRSMLAKAGCCMQVEPVQTGLVPAMEGDDRMVATVRWTAL